MKHKPLDVRVPIEEDNPSIVRHEEKCIACGMCKNVCTEAIGVHGTYTLEQTGGEAVCIHCGQCANVCPVDSITERYEYMDIREAVKNPDRIVIVSTSPSVRAALGEEFGMADGAFVEGKMVALLRSLGVDYVLDTNFAADLTIMEEASELIERVTKGRGPLPQFTSCCPAWVKFLEMYEPGMLPHVSTAKSPIGMQGPAIKTYFAKKMGLDPKKIVNVALTPCTAKKYEIRRDEMHAAADYYGISGMRDMDFVLTTREMALWAKEEGIDFAALSDSDYDDIMGQGSGAGVIFGNTGGVMEAALRTAYEYITGEEAPQQLYNLQPVRGYEGIREASVQIKDLEVKVAVVYGTANARKLLEKIKSGEKQYHFVEVMTCPGGCIGGGGQPKDIMKDTDQVRKERIASLYQRDEQMQLRKSHENPQIKQIYEEFYGKPLSEMAEKMLHTSYEDKSEIFHRNNEKNDEQKGESKMGKWKCKICGYIYEGDVLPEDYVCPVCKQPASAFEKIEEQKPSNPYAGTQTEKNLEAAFAGESQARNKYTYFRQYGRSSPGYVGRSETFTANYLFAGKSRFFADRNQEGNMFVECVVLLVGFVCLIKGADCFVDGSAALAAIFKVPGLIIGLTVVALGTSVPELAVSVSAALQGSNEIAVSNVVGSNIFNLLVVLGSCALLHAVPVENTIIKRDFSVAIGSTVFVLLATSAATLFGARCFLPL